MKSIWFWKTRTRKAEFGINKNEIGFPYSFFTYSLCFLMIREFYLCVKHHWNWALGGVHGTESCRKSRWKWR